MRAQTCRRRRGCSSQSAARAALSDQAMPAAAHVLATQALVAPQGVEDGFAQFGRNAPAHAHVGSVLLAAKVLGLVRGIIRLPGEGHACTFAKSYRVWPNMSAFDGTSTSVGIPIYRTVTESPCAVLPQARSLRAPFKARSSWKKLPRQENRLRAARLPRSPPPGRSTARTLGGGLLQTGCHAAVAIQPGRL